MPGPAPSWDMIPVYGTWRKLNGDPHQGSIEFKITTRVVSITDDVIFPSEHTFQAPLDAFGSISILLPAVDDPDNSPSSWSIQVTEKLQQGKQATYVIQPSLAMLPAGLNLRTIIVPGSTATPPAALLRGVAGGVAALDVDGDVVDANGEKVVGGPGGGPADWDTIADKPAFVAAGSTQQAARDAIGAQPAESYATSSALTSGLASKADQSALTSGLAGKVDTSALATKADTSALTSGLAGKADLVGGFIPTAQLPALAVVEYLGTAANQAAMLAKTGQKGDWVTRTDLGTTWVISGNDPTQLASWTALSYPAAPVNSVNGQTGVINLAAGDVGSVPTARTVNSKALTGNIVIAPSDMATFGADARTATGVQAVRYNGTAWPTPASGSVMVIFNSANYVSAPIPAGVNVGDLWFAHADSPHWPA